MKITAKLAFSQLRRNRHRTAGAVSAILLSTALTTAVFCFATSANEMLVSFLGEGYGNYGGFYQSLLLIPALFLSGLIFVMSVTVISNVFQASANQRMNEFGILKCTGGTTKQIRETVFFESIWLGIAGIPAGLLCGLAIGFFGVRVTGTFIAELNELQQSILMRPFSMELHFSVTPSAFLLSALLSFFTVLYSAYQPAKRAGKITALSCIRGIEDADAGRIKVRSRKWIQRAFGFEGILADRNVTRKKSGFQPTIKALAIGMLLLLSTESLAQQVHQIKEYMDPGTRDIVLTYSSNQKNNVIARPIHSSEAELVRQRLLAYGGIEVTGIGYDNGTYHVTPPPGALTAEMQKITGESPRLQAELLVLDQTGYEQLCETADVAVGSSILLNYYRYNDNGTLKQIVPFTGDQKVFTLEDINGGTMTVSIDAFLTADLVPPRLFALNEKPVRLVVPEAQLRFYDWYCHPEDEPEYTQYAKNLAEELFPTYTDDPYAIEGFMVRVSREDTMVRVLNIAVVMAEIILYGFIGVLLLIGLVTVISTLTTSVMMRAREFAVLKSVGMTTDGLTKMLVCESVICTLRATAWGIPAGILIPYLVSLILRKVLPIRYEIPWGFLLLSIAGVFSLILTVTFCAVHKLKQQNLMESIRNKTD